MRRLLIVIDLQKGWRHKTATEPAMLNTVKLCKKFSGDIIHCRYKNNPNGRMYKERHWTRFVEADDTDEIPEVVPLKLPTYWRMIYSCVTDELRPLLGKYDHIYIAGVFTDISVFVTAMEIFDMEIPVSVVTDCVGTLHGEPVHHYSLRSLSHGIGVKFLIQSEAVSKDRSAPVEQ